MLRTSVVSYSTFGFRDQWLRKYFATYPTFFDNTEHGLNPIYQIPSFTHWLQDAGILQHRRQTITELGKVLARLYFENPILAWEIIFINLQEGSEVVRWYNDFVTYGKEVSRNEMMESLLDRYPMIAQKSLIHPIQSMINTLTSTPLSHELGVAVFTKQDNSWTIKREPHNAISPLSVLYSLHRYAKLHDREDITITELYQPNQHDGIVHIFGVERRVVERTAVSMGLKYPNWIKTDLSKVAGCLHLPATVECIDIVKGMLK